MNILMSYLNFLYSIIEEIDINLLYIFIYFFKVIMRIINDKFVPN